MTSTVFYVHDPDVDETDEMPCDLQHIPMAMEDSNSRVYGATRLRSAVVISNPQGSFA